jgi:CheY-like chemotaxis protein
MSPPGVIAKRDASTVGAAPATVLVADDDDELRQALVGLLADEGYAVIEARNGAEALELLARAADEEGALPDVVLLDFVMPGFSGLGILRVMRRFAKPPPTIILTGFPDPAVESFARSLGAICVLRKPIDAAALRRSILEAATRGAAGGVRSA